MSDKKRTRTDVEKEIADYSSKLIELEKELKNYLRLGDRVLGGKEILGATAIEILALGSMLQLKYPSLLMSIQEGSKMAAHTYNTISDSAQGGPEGMRAARSLEQALSRVSEAAKSNKDASELLSSYTQSRQNFVNELMSVYNGNETVSRECSRLMLQLRGTVKHIFDAGSELKPDWFREQVDLPIIVTYAKAMRAIGKTEYEGLTDEQILIKAIESSENLRQFYIEARKFYDAREKNEAVIGSFCSYLENLKSKSEQQNQQIDSLFPKLLERVREGYSVEDFIMGSEHLGTESTTLRDSRSLVGNLDSRINQTYSEVRQTAPIREIPSWNWTDIATNPYAIAGIAVILTQRFLGKANNYVSKTVCWPFKKIGNSISHAYEYVSKKEEKNDSC